jgi:hypothetical protein
MRGSLVVLALAISTSVATVSKAQEPAPAGGSTKPICEKDPGNSSPTGEENRTKKCPPAPPPATGKVTITGTLFFDLAPYDGVFDSSNENGIAGWWVVITGPSGSSRFMTDGTGFFSFAGLPSGVTYTLCVEPSAGWTQTVPTSGASCLNSFGYTIAVPALVGDATVSDKNIGFYSNTP